MPAQPAPTPLESPAVRRSKYLADLLAQTRQAPPQIQSGGELGARLLAQGLAQFGANRADKAVQDEATTARASALAQAAGNFDLNGAGAPSATGQALGVALEGPGNTTAPVQATSAPVAPVEGGALPPANPSPNPAPVAPVAPVAASQAPFAFTPSEQAYARQLQAAGDVEGLQALAESVRNRNINADVRVGPDGQAYNANDPANASRVFANRQSINGFVTDLNDPQSEGRYLPDFQPGEEPLYDGQGKIVGVRNLSGAVEALAGRTRAVANANRAAEASYAGAIAGAAAEAQAPFQIETITTADGTPVTTSRADILSRGGVPGQSAADAERAVIEARGEGETAVARAERVRIAPERVARYEEALGLIPKAITGFGADQRLVFARAQAALGIPDAIEAVRATEVYQNLIGRDIGAIVRDMVGSTSISNSDRELATRIAGGDTNITPAALTRVVEYELGRQLGVLAPSGRPLTPEQAQRLPRGTTFTGADGQQRTVR